MRHAPQLPEVPQNARQLLRSRQLCVEPQVRHPRRQGRHVNRVGITIDLTFRSTTIKKILRSRDPHDEGFPLTRLHQVMPLGTTSELGGERRNNDCSSAHLRLVRNRVEQGPVPRRSNRVSTSLIIPMDVVQEGIDSAIQDCIGDGVKVEKWQPAISCDRAPEGRLPGASGSRHNDKSHLDNFPF
ncbi:Ab2-162 [Microcella alkaliphila]|uniref:Ab2-162 n=1 Tax=Microcella alkaliphila TaxID=279828 RepID=A0A0U5BK62_9MICO|nr:Ab2-162 [Microcella alkaliphila]